MLHAVKCFLIVNKAEADVFLELSCFFNDPVDVGNLISGSSAFSKSSLKFWKRWEYQTTLHASWEIKEQQLELDVEQQTGF